MEWQEVLAFLEENKESNEDVKGYLSELSQVTPDKVSSFLETEEGKKFLQPKMDSYFTKGLETWKSNNLKKLVDEEVKKLNPPTNPLEKELQDLKRELLVKDLKAKAKDVAAEQKLPVKLVDYFIGEDEESTLSNLKVFQEVFESQLNERVQAQLKSGGIDPIKPNSPAVTLNRTQLSAMSAEEIAKLDPKVVNEALKND